MEKWNPTSLEPEIITILVVTAIIFIACLIYYLKLKKIKVNEAPAGYVLVIQIYIQYIRALVVDIMGKRFEKLTPFFVFLMSYLLCCNLIGIVGFDYPTGSLTVTLSLGLIMFIGTFVIGFRFQKLSYLTRFCINYKSKKTGKHYPIMVNPLNLIEVVTPLISISFRLWGNIFAGGVIVSLWYFMFGYLTSFIPIIGVLSLLTGLVAPPIHGYFDIFVGCIQALVFTMLTMVYWSLAKDHGNYEVKDENLIDVKQLNVVRTK
ncbi:MAG: F0F1 ATP synthase subunit A [Mycoplasmataceae bacterium]|nr:F0F1 ATP synthase subunit A [Mycoplasmataceae bacterium]